MLKHCLPLSTVNVVVMTKLKLDRIDDYAKRQDLTRSDLMISSTLEYIKVNS